MVLDNATAGFITAAAESGQPPLAELTPAQARVLTAALAEASGPGPEVHAVKDYSIPVDGGEIRLRVLTPSATPRAIIAYFHGGGWVLGDIDEFDNLGRRLANESGCAVVLVDYRLAPEHRFPCAVDDSWAALLWIDERRQEIAGSRVPLIVMGDSAGGNLSAVLAQRALARGGPDLVLQVLVYPVADADTDTASYVAPENQLLLSRDTMLWFWDHYLPDKEARFDPEASPLRARDLSGLPRSVVVTAEHDPLRDEGEAYAAALSAAGVPVEHRRFPGQMHGFFTMVNVLPGSEPARAYIIEEIDRALSTAAENEA